MTLENESILKICLQTFAVWSAALILAAVVSAPLFIYFWRSPNSPYTAEVKVGFSRRPESAEPLAEWYKSQPPIINQKISADQTQLVVRYLNEARTEDPIVPEWQSLGYENAEIKGFEQNRSPFATGSAAVLFSLAMQIGLFLGALFGWRWLLKDYGLKDFFAGRFGIGRNILIGLAGGGIYLPVMYSCFGALEAIFGEAVFEGHPYELIALGLPTKIGMFLAAVVVAPFVEELLLRGVIFGKFLRAGFPIFGVAFSSILFAVAHPMPIQIITHTVGGAMLALIYFWTRSLLANILTHAAVNGSTFVIDI